LQKTIYISKKTVYNGIIKAKNKGEKMKLENLKQLEKELKEVMTYRMDTVKTAEKMMEGYNDKFESRALIADGDQYKIELDSTGILHLSTTFSGQDITREWLNKAGRLFEIVRAFNVLVEYELI
jgi:hypothetical protein